MDGAVVGAGSVQKRLLPDACSKQNASATPNSFAQESLFLEHRYSLEHVSVCK
jgi:hypothetical protein